MSPLLQGALNAIKSEDDEAVGEGFLILAEVIAVNRLQGFRSDIIPEANNEILEWGPLEVIQKVIIQWIENNSDHPHATSAFWALDKFRDKSLRPFLRHWLENYVQRASLQLGPMSQILVDLRSLGEPTYGNSFSSNELSKNFDAAVLYLRAYPCRRIPERDDTKGGPPP